MATIRHLKNPDSSGAEQKKPDKHPLTAKYVESARTHKRTTVQMVEEHVDNTLDANASKVWISTKEDQSNQLLEIRITDNGVGMDKSELYDSFTLAAAKSSYRENSIGKFGIGGTMSALARFDKKQTFSKTTQKGRIIGRGYETSQIEKEGQWVTAEISPDDTSSEILSGLSSGTHIFCTMPRTKQKHGPFLARLKRSLAVTYDHHIRSGKVEIYINENPIDAACPAGSDLKDTFVMHEEVIVIDGHDVSIKVADLSKNPNTKLREVASISDKCDADKTSNALIATCGFIFRRNSRVIATGIMPGDTCGSFPRVGGHRKRHPDVRYVRVTIDLPSSLDKKFGVTNDKNSVTLDEEVAVKIGNITKPHFAIAAALSLSRTQSAQAGDDEAISAEVAEKANSRFVTPKKKANRAQVEKGQDKPKVVPITSEKPTQGVENIRSTGNKWIDNIVTKKLGSGADIFVFDPTASNEKTLVLNMDHNFYTQRYSGRSKDSKSAIVSIFIALLSAVMEGSDNDRDSQLILQEHLNLFNRKLRAMS